MAHHILGFELEVPYAGFIATDLSTIIYFFMGWSFLNSLVEEVRKGAPGMMTALIKIALTVPFVYKRTVVVARRGWFSFWELAAPIIVMPVGN